MHLPTPAPVVLVLPEPLTERAVAALCATLCDLMVRTGADVACCDICCLDRPGLQTVGVLARLQLEAHRLGCSIRVWHAPRRFVVLLELLGLDEVVPCVDGDRDDRDPFAPEPGS